MKLVLLILLDNLFVLHQFETFINSLFTKRSKADKFDEEANIVVSPAKILNNNDSELPCRIPQLTVLRFEFCSNSTYTVFCLLDSLRTTI